MMECRAFADRSVAVFGLGRSGLSAARALLAGGARVSGWDDDPGRRQAAAVGGVPLADHYTYDFRAVSALVLSPGVALTHPAPHPVVGRARAVGCEVIGDIELFARGGAGARVVGVTGTNGKSTTTALIGHVLDALGCPVAVGGNLGTPVFDLPPLGPDGVYVLELSSFQLDLTRTLVCDVAVLLNIGADHLDRHGDLAGYVAVKKRILSGQRHTHTAVISLDDPHSAAIYDAVLAGARQRAVPVAVGRPLAGGVYVVDGVLHDATAGPESDGVTSVDLSHASGLRGAHNWQNAAAAVAAARALGLSGATMLDSLVRFAGLAHRMEEVAVVDGVLFVNDSKATNAGAAARALASFDNIYWIAGGRAKAGGIASLEPLFGRVAHAYLIGEAADGFAATLRGKVPLTHSGELASAVTDAFAAARRDGREAPVLLFSPACASFDQWDNFEARGDAFRAAANQVAAPAGAAGGECPR